jgi:hypothetical protein
MKNIGIMVNVVCSLTNATKRAGAATYAVKQHIRELILPSESEAATP